MEKLKLHEKPHINSSGIYFQSISTNSSEKYLFANAYGESEEEVVERAKLIAFAPEMLEILKDILHANNNDTLEFIDFYTIEELIKKTTT